MRTVEHKKLSVKQMTSIGAALFIILISSVTVLSLVSFSNTQNLLSKATEEYRPKMLNAQHLATDFYQSSTMLGNYMIEKNPLTLSLYHEKIKHIDDTLVELTRLTSINNEPIDQLLLANIKQLVGQIKEANKQLINFASSDNKNFPAIGRASIELEPLATLINQQISDLLLSAEQNKQSEMLFETSNLRFIWTMLVSEMRNFLAFRTPATLDKITMYVEGVKQAHQSVKQSTKMTDSDQLELFEETTVNLDSFHQVQQETLILHSGNKWRQDSLIIRNTINPTLKKLSAELELLINTQLRRIRESDKNLYGQISLAENTIFAVTVLAALIASYLIFMKLRTRSLKFELKQRKRKEREMWLKANYDHLTQLANRSLFNESFHNHLRYGSCSSSFSLLFIDLDGFKQVNDNISHAAGDEVLKETAKRLQLLVRDIDIVGRMGGDEFTILLRGINCPIRVEKIAKKICHSIAHQYSFQGKSIYISSSIGIVLSQPKDFDHHQRSIKEVSKQLMARADSAMYQAKQSGKNAFCFDGRESEQEECLDIKWA